MLKARPPSTCARGDGGGPAVKGDLLQASAPGEARSLLRGCPCPWKPLYFFTGTLFPYRLWTSLGRGRSGDKRGQGRGGAFLPPSSPRPGKRQHIEARGSQHQARMLMRASAFPQPGHCAARPTCSPGSAHCAGGNSQAV